MTSTASARRRADRIQPVPEVRAPVPWRRCVVSRAWWLSPIVLSLCLWIPLMLLATSVDEASFRTYFRTPRFISSEFTRLFYLCAVAFAVGAFVALQAARSRGRRLSGSWLLRSGFRRIVFRIWVAAAVISVASAAIRLGGPGGFLQAMSVFFEGTRGASDEIRDAFEPIPGLTSFTQLGMLIAALEMAKLTWAPSAAGRSVSRRRIAAVFAYALFRSMMVSERLAIVEVAIPCLLVWARTKPIRSVRQVVVTASIPLIAIFALLFGYAGTEYYRSYQYYRDHTDDSLMEFSRTRIVGYYATAINNSALHYHHDGEKAPLSVLLEGPLEFPGLRQTLKISDPSKRNERTLLELYANPEFNNVAPAGRLAREGANAWVALFMAGFGGVVGLAFAGYRFGSLGASVWFGLLTTATIEFPRIWYITNQRLSAVALVCLVGWFRYSRPSRRHR